MIDFFYWFIFNGYKVIVFFEEVGFEYWIYFVDISVGDQFKLVFLVFLFNNCMFVIID